jgi:Flp pilus assembly protein TadG
MSVWLVRKAGGLVRRWQDRKNSGQERKNSGQEPKNSGQEPKNSGNVAVTFALIAPVLLIVTTIAIDFGYATTVKKRLDAAADAAALSALTPTMLQQSDSVAQAAATAMFKARAAGISTLATGQTVVSVVITHPNNSGLVRQATVTYTAQANAIFSNPLQSPTMKVGGTSTAKASIPPNIDFYLLLDNSPSMSLPATSAGVTQMQNLTVKQASGAGCAFACHQASTNNGDTAGNPCSDGSTPTQSSGAYCAAKNSSGQAITQIDNYALARKNNITLKLDELSNGVTQLTQVASKYQTSAVWATPPQYRFAAYQMDTLWQVGATNNLLMGLTSDYVNSWTSSSANFGVMEMYANSVGCANAACTLGVSFNDVATNYDVAMSSINATMPTPGGGSNLNGDTPQEVMFLVTDGVEDEQNLVRLIQPINAGLSTNYCTLIKARGIKIAVLYTAYLPVPANSFYMTYVAPIQANLGPALQACASPGLYYQAAIGANLGTALSTLFQAAVQSAALSN